MTKFEELSRRVRLLESKLGLRNMLEGNDELFTEFKRFCRQKYRINIDRDEYQYNEDEVPQITFKLDTESMFHNIKEVEGMADSTRKQYAYFRVTSNSFKFYNFSNH